MARQCMPTIHRRKFTAQQCMPTIHRRKFTAQWRRFRIQWRRFRAQWRRFRAFQQFRYLAVAHNSLTTNQLAQLTGCFLIPVSCANDLISSVLTATTKQLFTAQQCTPTIHRHKFTAQQCTPTIHRRKFTAQQCMPTIHRRKFTAQWRRFRTPGLSMRSATAIGHKT